MAMRDGRRSGRATQPGKATASASITAVAERAGVSIATVSRIVNGVPKKASPETVSKVRRAIADLGYRPASAGRALRQGRSRLVALLAANLANPAMAAVAASSEVALRERGLTMVVCDTHERPELQDEYLREMRAERAQAVVLLAAVDSGGLADALAAGMPLLYVNRRAPGAGGSFVGIDNSRAGEEVADHLSARGHERIALIHGPLQSSATADRVRAFRSRLRRRGTPLDPDRVATAPGLDHLEIGYSGMGRLLEIAPPPDGLFCSSDLIAFGAHRRALEAGLRVPEQLEIVGFDDSPLNDWIAPWLNSVRVPYEVFGPAIADTVEAMRVGAGLTPQILPHRLVVRAR